MSLYSGCICLITDSRKSGCGCDKIISDVMTRMLSSHVLSTVVTEFCAGPKIYRVCNADSTGLKGFDIFIGQFHK